MYLYVGYLIQCTSFLGRWAGARARLRIPALTCNAVGVISPSSST